MKVLLVHNYYRQRGGEDLSFEDECRLLQEAGHDVLRYLRHNDDILNDQGLRVARRALWNADSYREVREILRRERPDVMHCTNTFPLISPSVYYAAAAEKVPVVQSLRNYRLLCLNSFLNRDNHPCELCIGRTPWSGIQHACYRNSRLASAAVAGMLWIHRWRKTYSRYVDVYYTLTHFARQKFLEGGLPTDRILVKPNCVHPDPGIGCGDQPWAVFAGRLSPEKGIDTLLEAWPRVASNLQLKIVGDGPLADRIRQAAASDTRIELLGRLEARDALEVIGRARMLIMPSVWYETFGRTIIEAFAKGVPVVASRLGAMEELVEDQVTGRLFTPGDAGDLAQTVNALVAHPAQLAHMRQAAREIFLDRYTSTANYERLLHIYETALRRRGITPPLRAPTVEPCTTLP